MNKTIIIFIIVLIVVGGGAFYGGMLYGKSQGGSRASAGFQNLTPAQRQQFGANGNRQGRVGANGNNFTAGQVIAKDDKSVTVKLQDGGSKIIFLSLYSASRILILFFKSS